MGAVTIGLAYLAPLMGPTLLYIALSIFGMVGGPLLGLFTQAIFFPMCNEWVCINNQFCKNNCFMFSNYI